MSQNETFADHWFAELEVGDAVIVDGKTATIRRRLSGPAAPREKASIEVVMDGRQCSIHKGSELLPANPEDMFPYCDWRYDVANGDTRLGFDEWLEHQLEGAGFVLAPVPA